MNNPYIFVSVTFLRVQGVKILRCIVIVVSVPRAFFDFGESLEISK